MNPRVQATGRKGSAASSRDGAKAPPSQDPSTTIQPSLATLAESKPAHKSVDSGRRYGPTENEPDIEEDDGSVQSNYVDLKKMNNAQLRQHSMRRFGARYSDNETDDNIRGDIQKRMAMKTGMQRYRD
jgi:hypothetical protein